MSEPLTVYVLSISYEDGSGTTIVCEDRDRVLSAARVHIDTMDQDGHVLARGFYPLTETLEDWDGRFTRFVWDDDRNTTMSIHKTILVLG